MPKNSHFFRAVSMAVLVCFLHLTVLPSILSAQTLQCPYDRAKPSLESARIAFKSLNYRCAEQELQDLLKNPALTIEDKADAHVLLAAVYYAMLQNDTEKRNRVIEQFKAAFMAYREWKGELDISSTEFFDMMKQAQDQVDKEATAAPPTTTTTTPPTATETTTPAAKEQPQDTAKTTAVIQPSEEKAGGGGKPFYTKWWAIALGIGLVAGAVALGGGGGSDDGGGGGPLDTLPNFPDPPTGK